MPQELCLHTYLTGLETLSFYGMMHGLEWVEIELRIEDLVSLLQLANILHKRSVISHAHIPLV